MLEVRMCLQALLFLSLIGACRMEPDENLMNRKKILEDHLQANTKEAQLQKRLAIDAKEQRLFAEAEAVHRMASVEELVVATENQKEIVDEVEKELQFLKQQLKDCSAK